MKESVYCSNFTCQVRTCGRHKCHHPDRWTNKSKYDVWVRYGPLDEDEFCEIYKGSELFSTLLNIPIEWEVEDE